jgi:adenylyl- and sulfurtransferase ThiI
VAKQHIVVHYHELWLKGGNRHFFVGRLITAVRQSLEGLGLAKLQCPGDRIVIELEELNWRGRRGSNSRPPA